MRRQKKMAEDNVSKACEEKKIKATIIRPRGIIGPYDQNILPRILQISKKGFMPLLDGGKAKIDVTYVENVVDAMLLALKPGKHQDGKAYNITNDEPIILRDLLAITLNELGMNIPFKNVPYSVANILANAMEIVCKVLPTYPEPPLTQYSAGVFALSQTLNIDSAKNDLGYRPNVSLKDGIAHAAKWWKENEDRL